MAPLRREEEMRRGDGKGQMMSDEDPAGKRTVVITLLLHAVWLGHCMGHCDVPPISVHGMISPAVRAGLGSVHVPLEVQQDVRGPSEFID